MSECPVVKFYSEKPVRRGSEPSAGMDLPILEAYEAYEESGVVVVDTGVRVEIPAGYVGLLMERSSLDKKGFHLGNGVGVIDSDYRGTIKARLRYDHHSLASALIALDRLQAEGAHLVQLLVVPSPVFQWVPCASAEELGITKRGSGGFGSTGA